MLLQFSVTNHRSIKDTAIISLKAIYRSKSGRLPDFTSDEKKQVVPKLALYGANAAGKSNVVLHALLLMREMVCGRYAKMLKGEPLPQEPVCFSQTNLHSRPALKLSISMAASRMPMGSLDKSRILTEYLLSLA